MASHHAICIFWNWPCLVMSLEPSCLPPEVIGVVMSEIGYKQVFSLQG